MEPSKITRVKICCIASIEEAWMAIRYGASALGLVSEMPSGPGVISEELIKGIASIIPAGVSSFLLTCKEDASSIIAQQKRCCVNTIQLCDSLIKGSYRDLREAMPGISIVQVIHVTGPDAVEEALSVAPYVDGILLDSGNPGLKIKELGGTGRTHNWDISKKIREKSKVPVFLAGGLTPQNVGEAIKHVGPFCVDVCSGVRTDGKLDEVKLSEFFRQVREEEYFRVF
ncbi:MAG TPA: phosphoribosylanthranilate isomerase [Candidatus Eremiobacteraeota bacterium]|nr:MAG: N-(5'-phosphoribosyl)anthranilate isomerase [bacterium ADurb.Bin363]HPZ08246.1 phosphoribosylanthranilate isomerase [Candidatus Eremiobacteraeota bacterium]